MEGVKIRKAVLADAEQLHGLFRLHDDYADVLRPTPPGSMEEIIRDERRYGTFYVAERKGRLVAAIHAKNSGFVSNPFAKQRPSTQRRWRAVVLSPEVRGKPGTTALIRSFLAEERDALVPQTMKRGGSHTLRKPDEPGA